MNDKLHAIQNSVLRPKVVYRHIQDSPYADLSLHILITFALVTGLNSVGAMQVSITWLNVLLIMVAAIVSTAVGVILYAGLLGWVSNLFTKADVSNKIRLALPFSFVPSIVGGVILLFPVGKELISAIRIVSGIWSLILLVILIMEIKKLDVARAILTIVIASMVVVAPMLVFYSIVKK